MEALGRNRSVLTILELLDIKEFNRSRRENGQYSMFARGRLQEKLMSELEWHGCPFLEVEPAFTSQTCPVCGNLNRENRDGKIFHCTYCGYEDDADYVGSINIRARTEDEELVSICDAEKYNKNRRHKAIQALLAKRCQEWQKKNRQSTEQEKTLSRENVQDVSFAFGEGTACITPPAI